LRRLRDPAFANVIAPAYVRYFSGRVSTSSSGPTFTSRGRHCCAKDDRPWVEEQTDGRTDYVCLCRGIAK
jgi:hypothetical protein